MRKLIFKLGIQRIFCAFLKYKYNKFVSKKIKEF